MSLVIIRFQETGKRTNHKRLPGHYGDDQKAMAALEKVLQGYKSHGHNAEEGYYWARDERGQQFRFVISSATANSTGA